jgi:S1-C subfamily serine protease
MQFLGELLIGFFTAYLALTNAVAENIESLFSADVTIEESATFAKLSSAYESIPKILIENAAYQSGNVTGATTQATTTTDPTQALVNIFCTYTTDSYTRTTTGTGFFINPDGIILTNAHVAQFLLLETVAGNTDCIIRTGNPAEPTYKADLLYIPPAWVEKHAALIDAVNPTGTGERDYALLYVTAGLDNKPMPRHFPALALNTQLVPIQAIGWPVQAAGYPAEELFKAGDMQVDLIPVKVRTRIAELMAFGSNYADLMTINGSPVGEQGSSGGPVLNSAGETIGIISTKGDDEQFGQGSLRALTLSYVDRTITEETGFTLGSYLGANLPYRSKLFKDTLEPFLREMLEAELN